MLRLPLIAALLCLQVVSLSLAAPVESSTSITIRAQNVSSLDVKLDDDGQVEGINVTQVIDKKNDTMLHLPISISQNSDKNTSWVLIPPIPAGGQSRLDNNYMREQKFRTNDGGEETTTRSQRSSGGISGWVIPLIGTIAALLLIGGILLALFLLRRSRKNNSFAPQRDVTPVTADEDNATAALTSNMHETKMPQVADTVMLAPTVAPVLAVPILSPPVPGSLTCVDNPAKQAIVMEEERRAGAAGPLMTTNTIGSPNVRTTTTTVEESTIVIPVSKTTPQHLEQSSPSSGSPLIDQDEIMEAIKTIKTTVINEPGSSSLVTTVLNDPTVSANLTNSDINAMYRLAAE